MKANLTRILKRLFILSASLTMLTSFFIMSISASETMSNQNESLNAVPYSGENKSTNQKEVPVSYGLSVLSAQEEIVFTGLCGHEINLTAQDICRAMNISSLNYITVTALPSEQKGTLYVGTVGASKGQVITAGSLSLLSYASETPDTPCESSFKISVNGSGYEITCLLRLTDKLNYTPTISLAPDISLTVETYADMIATGTLSSYDPEGDEITYEIVRYAEHGRIALKNKHTGAYTYTPDQGYTGNDSFSYVVRDSYGNYSTSVDVSVTVSNRPSIQYSDIENHPYAPSILKISEYGLMNGTIVGNDQYFKPDQSVSRIEFLITAMNAAGITREQVKGLSSPSFADADEIPDSMAPYVSLAVQRGYIAGKEIDGQLCFCPTENISRAEAAVILSNIIGYAKQTTVTAFADSNLIPVWSVKALTSLKSLGILMPTDGEADAGQTMTRGMTAHWIERTIRVISE